MTSNILCFGEVLWDLLPTSKQPGGAPMNVAASLRKLGLDAQLISCIGRDKLGNELLDFFSANQFPLELIQVNSEYPTGIAKANLSDASQVEYIIVEPVAWDYIYLEPSLIYAVQKSDLFVFGSLAARSPVTQETLFSLLEAAPRKVFDANLRSPYYEQKTLEALLRLADIVKLNEHELAEIDGWHNRPASVEQAIQRLRDRYQLEMLCVIMGEKGAVLLDKTGFKQQMGFSVQVEDTIGSGDTFLAAFLYKLLQEVNSQESLEFACAAGAYQATQRGAAPSFTEAIIYQSILRSTLS